MTTFLNGRHEAGDGLPPRRVFVDGLEYRTADFADVDRGLVRYAPEPVRVSKTDGGRIYRRWIKGSVIVEEIE